VLVRRFENLCRFLSANPGKFRTRTFGELKPSGIALDLSVPPLASNIGRTAIRYVQQIADRFIS
jgi:hypothetical protein